MIPDRSPARRSLATAQAVVSAVGAVALAFVGLLLVVDRGGLRAEYRALGVPWEGRAYAVRVAPPELPLRAPSREAELAPGGVLISHVLFSVRWQGWWRTERGGELRFVVDADDAAWMRIDGELVIDTEGRFGAAVARRAVQLGRGFHALEIGYRQGDGGSGLSIGVARGDLPAQPLAADDLYAGRPLALRAALRRLLASWARPWRQLFGGTLLLAALGWIVVRARGWRWTAALAGAAGRAPERLLASRRWRAALLAALVVAAFLAVLPFTGSIRGGDDASYLTAAKFDKASWFHHRYAHVFLLKLFVTLCGGDPFLGTRVWWSFAFAVTVGALAVAVRSVGPGLQLRTLAVTLFVLLAQAALFGRIGAAFADVSAMMFLTAAVAVWLHGRRRRPEPSTGRPDGHALALGALTVAAWQAKEVGAVGFALLLLDACDDGRLDWRRWTRRAVWWAAGAFGALGLLVLLDGWLLGDFGFMFDDARRAASRRMNFPPRIAARDAADTWLAVVWNPAHVAGATLRNLWIAVGAAAVAAGVRRWRAELRLLHLLPLAYLLALVALYVRMPHPFSGRMLLPILPAACLMAGLLAHHAGLDEVPWRQLAALPVAVPTALAGAVLTFIFIPWRLGTISAADLVPADLVGRFGWTPEQFVSGVLSPALALVATAGLALVAGRREARLAALLLAFLALFGPGFAADWRALATRRAAQTGDLLRYPWQAFRSEIAAARPRLVALSADLVSRYGMARQARSAVAGLAVGRRGFRVRAGEELPRDADLAIASPAAFERWRLEAPALAATARRDAAGLLVLVRPKQALASAGSGSRGRRAAPRP